MFSRPLLFHLLIALLNPLCTVDRLLVSTAAARPAATCGEPLLPVPQVDMPHGPTCVRSADFNGDGHADLVSVQRISEEHFSVLFGNGNGTFSEPVVVPTQFRTTAVETADFNGDGDIDIAVVGTVLPGWQGFVSLYENEDGRFSLLQTVEVIGFPETAAAADYDRDGSIDLAVGGRGSESAGTKPGVSVLRWDGEGFSVSEFIWTDDVLSQLAVGDVNGDGSPDLVANHWPPGPIISVLLGDGVGAFPSVTSIDVGQSVRELVLGDMDGNGALDIVMSALDGIQVLFNPGDGRFGPPVGFAGRFSRDLALIDLDADGDRDVASINTRDMVLWLNDGSGALMADFELDSVFPDMERIQTGEFTSDGLEDLVILHDTSNELISILPGEGDGGVELPERISSDGAVVWYKTLADFNQDGHLDLLFNNNNTSVNIGLGNGDGTFGPFEVCCGLGGLKEALVADLDRDGAPDLVIGNDNMMAVLLNDGLGQLDILQTLPVPTRAAAAGDFSGDGLIDLAAVGWQNDTLTVMYNEAGIFQIHAVYPTPEGPISVAAGDVDDDGWLDLVVGSVEDELISVFRNNGKGDFERVEHYEVLAWPSAPVLEDLDDDGDLDLALTMFSIGGGGRVGIMLNNGDGSFAEIFLVEYHSGLSGMNVIDFDGDRRLDFVLSSFDDENVRVFTAVEPGVTYQMHGFGAFHRVSDVAVGDLDGDGDPDVVAGRHDLLVFLNRRCPIGDLDEDGVVGLSDLTLMTAAWGPCPPVWECPADLDADGVVGLGDLLRLLDAWG